MSQTLTPIGDCCQPCESPLVENIPGPQGINGTAGANGTNGLNAFTTFTANFTQPAVGANVTVSLANSEWASIGQEVFSESGGYYLVIARPTTTSLTIQNRGYTANAAPGVVIPNGSRLSPAGEKGEAGTNGSTANIPLTTKGDILAYDTAPARMGVGTDGKVLAADSAQALGLAYTTIHPNTATDNAIARYDGATGKPVPQQDSKVVITDDGALQASGSGGNARGARAVDLQVSRTLATEVASGADATIAGGGGNSATGAASTVGGGESNIASGLRAVTPGGLGNQVTGDYAAIGGGSGSLAAAQYSTIPGGYLSYTDLFGQLAHASGRFASNGDAQASELIFRNNTADNTPTELFLNGASERAIIRDSFTWVFRINMVARDSASGFSAAWEAKGSITRSAGATTLLAAATIALIAADAGSIADGWGIAGAVAVTADNTNESLKIAVTGAVGKAIRWVAHARLVEVSW